MSEGNYGGRKDTKVLEFERDALSGELKPKTIPTVVQRGATIVATIDTNVALEVGTAGFVPSGTAPLRLTYLRLGATFERIDYALADRDGTVDIIAVGTAVAPAGGGAGARGSEIILQGKPDAPIHVINGTMNIYNTSGSQSAGSYTVVWEGVQ